METILTDCWLGHRFNDGFLIPCVYFVPGPVPAVACVLGLLCSGERLLRPLYPEMTGRKANA